MKKKRKRVKKVMIKMNLMRNLRQKKVQKFKIKVSKTKSRKVTKKI